jgi:hypothetical protein
MTTRNARVTVNALLLKRSRLPGIDRRTPGESAPREPGPVAPAGP